MHESTCRTGVALGIVVALSLGAPALAGTAKGTIAYKGTTATIAHAYLVRGPDAVDETKTIRRIVLTAADLQSKLTDCKGMSCTDGEVGEGMTIDLDGGPRLNYWVALKGQKVQYSGAAEPAALKTTTDEPGHMAGRFAVDDTSSGGPKVDVQFDAALLKEFQAAR